MFTPLKRSEDTPPSLPVPNSKPPPPLDATFDYSDVETMEQLAAKLEERRRDEEFDFASPPPQPPPPVPLSEPPPSSAETSFALLEDTACDAPPPDPFPASVASTEVVAMEAVVLESVPPSLGEDVTDGLTDRAIDEALDLLDDKGSESSESESEEPGYATVRFGTVPRRPPGPPLKTAPDQKFQTWPRRDEADTSDHVYSVVSKPTRMDKASREEMEEKAATSSQHVELVAVVEEPEVPMGFDPVPRAACTESINRVHATVDGPKRSSLPPNFTHSVEEVPPIPPRLYLSPVQPDVRPFDVSFDEDWQKLREKETSLEKLQVGWTVHGAAR